MFHATAVVAHPKSGSARPTQLGVGAGLLRNAVGARVALAYANRSHALRGLRAHRAGFTLAAI